MLGRDAEAITAFHSTIALDPRHVDALDRLGNQLRTYDRQAEAIDCFRRVAEITPDTTQGRLNRVKVLLEENRYDDAISVLRESITVYPDHAETKRTLASILREQGRFDEAIPLLEAVTEGTPAQAAAAYFDMALSKRITAADEPMLEQMQALLDYRPLGDDRRMWVHFALGKAYDDIGDYAAAMRHYETANRMVADTRPFDRAHFGAWVHRLITSSGAELFSAHRGSPSELPVLILGMPRSGTTLVEQIVSSHPDVGAGGELSFWNRAAEMFTGVSQAGGKPEQLTRIAAECESVLTTIAPEARRVTDKRPGNFLWIGLFHLTFPRGRIIHCRRNPLDTCLSNYFTYFMAPNPFAYDKGSLAFYYRTYLRLMAHWREVLPPEVFFEVDYEELVADPEPVTRRMIDFLGLPWDDACLRPQDNRRIVRTASQWQARQPTYRTSVERWRRYEPWLGELRQLLDDPPSDGEVHPTTDNPKLPVARRLREAARFDEAISTLQEALRASRNDEVLYNELGTVFLQTGQVAEAVECLERAIGLNPNFAVAHYNLGAALEQQERRPIYVVRLPLLRT